MTSPDPAVLVAEYQAGDSLAAVAARHHVHARTVREAVLAAGVPLRPTGPQPIVTPGLEEAILAQLDAGHSMRSTAGTLGVSVGTVKRVAVARHRPRTTRVVPEPRQLTPDELAALEAAWRRLPRKGRTQVIAWAVSAERDHFLSLVRSYQSAGVPISWQARALHIPEQTLHGALRKLDALPEPRPVTTPGRQ